MINIIKRISGWGKENSPEEALKNEFKRRKPWITKFVIDGKEYGGEYDAWNDAQIDTSFQYFPASHTILEPPRKIQRILTDYALRWSYYVEYRIKTLNSCVSRLF